VRISFVNPPFFPKYSREQRSPAVTKSGTFYYPMWLSYATGYAERKGHKVRLWDAPAAGWTTEDLVADLSAFQPGLVVISTSTPSIYNDVRVAASVKDALPDAFVVLVGVHVSAMPEETLALDLAVDAVVIGEYELTIVGIAECLDNGRDLETVTGLVYRGLNRQVVTNLPRHSPVNLDEIPWVSRTYRKFLNYRDYFYSGNLYPLVVFVTSRGCPHKCSFCVYPQTFTGHHLRCRSVGDVVDEMEYVIQEFSPLGEIMFEDDTLNINKERTLELCEEILRRGLKVRWSCNARVQLDLETMRLMKRSGCRSLLVGFESGSQEVLKGMRKGNKLERYERFMQDTRKTGLLVNGAFLVGCPGETKKTMYETLEMAKKLNPDVAQFFPVMVYPGTELFDEYKRQGYIVSGNFRDWLNEDGLHNCVVDLPEVSAKDMVKFCDFARRQFYLRPSYVLSKAVQGVRDPREGVRTAKAARAFFKHLLFGTRLAG
jgi:anaerobic magnesium-protoporphyrin IX monomethyl ester cyclase